MNGEKLLTSFGGTDNPHDTHGDWASVFEYANGNEAEPHQIPGASAPATTFGMSSVAEVFGAIAGENDGPDWIAYGRLHDGRFFSLKAGCDYTGWDCQADGEAWVGDSRRQVWLLGLDEDARRRFKEAGVQEDEEPPGDRPGGERGPIEESPSYRNSLRDAGRGHLLP